MKFFHPWTPVAATFVYVVLAVIAQPASSCNSLYTRFPNGKTTYGMDDGGCFFCAIHPGTKVPLSGEHLAEHCKRMCDFDGQCVAYTVGRPAALPAQQYFYGAQTNCCLERREYPPEAFVDANKENWAQNKKTDCQLEAMCWTRYEKKKGLELTASQHQCEGHASFPPTPSDLCSPVWPATTFSDEQVQSRLDFISSGCAKNDTTTTSMLVKAHDQCKEEIFAESMAVSVIVHSSGIYTYVSVDQ
mmetsp:Transcript_32851/g.69110  ORF Transcript_32851/g.69110 Transcript_32851/m.69110 type:complete len:245 (-) Transcript_32851:411-1145(-)|eukprot:CAMPEP_0172324242 /NCGR_PEP_ID=MMETSP1058-20130122/50826_1 /TAXON_ID=83371 /ORGANISM="Detonula confervacea, Strain CCMP 353" /LENGTH=244 /DNA_ID=CAMNT_0013040455 /DNA_START=149 /DNA_END=883 /DNA_ORIENTATION=+